MNRETNTYNPQLVRGRDVFLRNGEPIDVFGKLESADQRKYFLRGLIKKFHEQEYKKRSAAPYENTFIERQTGLFVDYIEGRIGTFDKIHSIDISHGILIIRGKEGEMLLEENALMLWENILKGSAEMKKVLEASRQKTESLREEAMTESLFGGSVIVKYTTIGAASALGAESAYRLSQSWQTGQTNLYNGFQRMSEILLRTPEGTFDRIDLRREGILKELGAAISGDRPSLKSRTMMIVQRLGYAFDPIKKTFTHIDRQVFLAARELIQRLSLQELRNRFGLVTATERELIETRKTLMERGGSIDWKSYTRGSMFKLLGGSVMHAIMWPVFFHLFTKRQNSANFVAGLTDIGLFTAGLKIGNNVGKMGGVAGRFIAPMLTGGGMVVAGHIGFDHLGGSQLKWEHFNGEDMYNYRRSGIAHGINLAAPETLDQINKSRATSINAGIPTINWTQIFGKRSRKMPLTAGTGVTPEITFIQSRVNLGVDPVDWMGGSLNNRNKNKWNIEVSRYKDELKKGIFRFIEQYQKDQPPFFPDDSPTEKLKLFEDILKTHILNGTGSDFYNLERAQITVVVLSEIQKWRKERSYQLISDIIDNYLEGMYINRYTLENEKFRSEGEKQSLETQLGEFALTLEDEKLKEYFLMIFDRMQKGERIFEEDTVESNPFSDRAYRKFSEEHKLFLRILKSTKKIAWGKENTQAEQGKIFALLLDKMSNFVLRRDTMQRLSQIPDDENGGYWREIEFFKKLVQ